MAIPSFTRRYGERPMTVAAMRAAVVAIRAGVFEDVTGGDLADGRPAIGAAGAAGTRGPNGSRRLPWSDNGEADVVVVVAGHAGAGASTVAVAVAEALAEERLVRLVDYAEPVSSGLTAASTIELGADGAGWRRGRRGRLDVFRLARDPADAELPPLPETEEAAGLLVVDAGWSLTGALYRSPGFLVRAAKAVVVTRVAVPAVRQTEQVLAAIDAEAVVGAVGPARWPGMVEASCGPRLGELRSRGRVVSVPVDRRLEIAGLTGDRLPKPVAAAGRSLAALLVPGGPAQPPRRHRRGAERPRTGSAGQRR